MAEEAEGSVGSDEQLELFDVPEEMWNRRRCRVCGCALSRTYPYTYLVQRQEWVKIGGTANPRRRINELSRWDWQQYILWPKGMDWHLPVVPLFVVVGEVEHELHAKFAAIHVVGEWFQVDSSIQEYIDSLVLV